MAIFKASTSPVAVVESETGIKGLLEVKADRSGSVDPSANCPLAIRQVRGQRAANVQMIANLNNDAYYTLFGDKMCDWNIVCYDLPGACDNDGMSRLSDMVEIMNNAISSGVLPTIKLTYNSNSVTGGIVTVVGFVDVLESVAPVPEMLQLVNL